MLIFFTLFIVGCNKPSLKITAPSAKLELSEPIEYTFIIKNNMDKEISNFTLLPINSEDFILNDSSIKATPNSINKSDTSNITIEIISLKVGKSKVNLTFSYVNIKNGELNKTSIPLELDTPLPNNESYINFKLNKHEFKIDTETNLSVEIEKSNYEPFKNVKLIIESPYYYSNLYCIKNSNCTLNQYNQLTIFIEGGLEKKNYPSFNILVSPVQGQGKVNFPINLTIKLFYSKTGFYWGLIAEKEEKINIKN